MSKRGRALKPMDEDAEDRLLKSHPRLRLLSKQIQRQQERLKRELSAEGWQIYLRLEELMQARYFELLARLRAQLHVRHDP